MNDWITHTVFNGNRDEFGHEATYPTEAQAQRGANSMKRKWPFYETQIIAGWRQGTFKVQYRKLPGF